MERVELNLTEDFITLGKLLKYADIISSGGMAKWYLSEFPVYVNDELENRRGKKLFVGDYIEFPNEDILIHLI